MFNEKVFIFDNCKKNRTEVTFVIGIKRFTDFCVVNLVNILHRYSHDLANEGNRFIHANQANQMNQVDHVTWIRHFGGRLDASDTSSALNPSYDRVQELRKVQQVHEEHSL